MAVSNVDKLAVVPTRRASCRWLLVWDLLALEELVKLLRPLTQDAAVDNAEHGNLATNAQRSEIESEETVESRYPEI